MQQGRGDFQNFQNVILQSNTGQGNKVQTTTTTTSTTTDYYYYYYYYHYYYYYYYYK